jgi:hypothetical protein
MNQHAHTVPEPAPPAPGGIPPMPTPEPLPPDVEDPLPPDGLPSPVEDPGVKPPPMMIH